jgi:cation transport ATPase
MLEFFVALAMSIVVFCYWVACRRASLEKRRVAVEAIESLASGDSINPAELKRAVSFYRWMTRWYTLPAMTLFGWPVVAWGVFSGAIERDTKVKRESEDAMNASFIMYVTRNPLTSVTCLFLMSCMITLITPLALIFSKLKEMPSAMEAYRSLIGAQIEHSQRR